MIRRMNSLLVREDGQGMTEYIIIVALIAIAAIGIITVFGQNLRALFAASSNALGGQTNQTTSAAGGGIQATIVKKGLSNFNKDFNSPP